MINSKEITEFIKESKHVTKKLWPDKKIGTFNVDCAF